VIATVFALVCTFGAYFSGALTHLFFGRLPEIGGKPNPELLMPQLVAQFMPVSFGMVLLLLIFAASMSTLSSLVLVSSSAIAIDLLSLRSKKGSILVMRILCGVFIFFSLLIAFYRPTFIVNLMSISWGTTAGAFLAPYLYGLYWKKANTNGAIVSMICGVVIGFGLSWYYGFSSQVIPLIGSLAMLIPLGILPAVSLLSAKGK
ncbi:MAG: sodium:solute symporter, partial [Atribacterota bacterium]